MAGETVPVRGTVEFYRTIYGVPVVADIFGLPYDSEEGVFAFHIHNGTDCSGSAEDSFSNAGAHLDLQNDPHPKHAGDMPPLFSNGGKAFLAFITDRFTLEEVLGKTVIIHERPDDFTTQPSGNAGSRIACGILRKVRR